MLDCMTHDVNGVLVITCEDAAEPREGMSFREMLYKAVESRDDLRFAVDLGPVGYLASADFGFLISLKRRIDAKKGRFVIFQVNSFIFDTLKTMRLDQFFTIATDLNDAIAKLGGPTNA